MVELEQHELFIRDKVAVGWSHFRISDFLRSQYPGRRGYSERSVRRFCSNMKIYKTSRLSSSSLNSVVFDAVTRVGPTYGRKTMTGLLASNGIRVSQVRVGQSLKAVSPSYHLARCRSTARKFNPAVYTASHFGHKLHIDQNEKLCMYGVTHVAAIDGYSGMIVGFVSMAVKNNILIYEHLFRRLLFDYGMWDQLRVDKGREWFLMLFVQEKLRNLRGNTSVPPYLQSSSQMNHAIERIWVEVNSRVNYPVKKALNEMLEMGHINLDDASQKYCISWYSLQVASVGSSMVVAAWNCHPIPGKKGIPTQRMLEKNYVSKLNDLTVVPSVDDAVAQYEDNGGNLTIWSQFGIDPLSSNATLLSERHRLFSAKYPDFSSIFYSLVNDDAVQFKNGLRYFIELTDHLTKYL